MKRGYEELRAAEEARKRIVPVRTFCPIWMDPLMTIHGATFISDMLDLVGAQNVFADRERRYPLAADLGKAKPLPPEKVGARDVRYPRVTMDEVNARAPELVLLPDEPHPFSEADADVFRAQPTPAAARGAVVRMNGKDLLLVRRAERRGDRADAGAGEGVEGAALERTSIDCDVRPTAPAIGSPPPGLPPNRGEEKSKLTFSLLARRGLAFSSPRFGGRPGGGLLRAGRCRSIQETFAQTATARPSPATRTPRGRASAVAPLRLPRDPLEVKPETADDAERGVIVRRGGDADAVRVERAERPVHRGARRLGHEPLAARVAPEPVPELDALMQVRERLQPDDAHEPPPDPVANPEAARARVVPVGRARLRVAEARLGIDVERHPRQPRLEVRARRIDRGPEIARVGRVDRGRESAGSSRSVEDGAPGEGGRRAWPQSG